MKGESMMQIYWTKINKIIEETSEVKTYLLDCPKDFSWEEGSHTHFALKGFKYTKVSQKMMNDYELQHLDEIDF